MKLKKITILLIVLIILINLGIGGFLFLMRKVDNKSTPVEITVSSGMSVNSILNLLEENNLIRNKLVAKVYVKLNKFNMQAGVYDLNSSMNTREIIKSIANGTVTNKYNISITFKEGKNIMQYAKVIADNTNNTVDDVYNLLKDEEYINEVVDKYWFLTDDIKNSELYYPLEGYLFPETYTFDSKDVSVKEIFNRMLDQMNTVLNKYKDEIEKKNLNVHEFLTLASVVELEGKYADDRATIAGVFYNRLKMGDSLGSDVTTYYAVKKDMGENPVLWQADIEFDSPYNTRLSKMSGKLPVGPISNAGESSIKACISPVDTDYYFFVADCSTGKTVFTKTYGEHVSAVEKIRSTGCEF